MKLTRKHIGGLFTNGDDGSWVYQLVAIKGKELLFYTFDRDRYEVDTNKFADWKRFQPRKPWPKNWIEYGWATARRNQDVVR